MPSNAPKLAQIDGLRGIAAVLLATSFHQFLLLGQIRSGPFDNIPALNWLHIYGWTMVDLFFVVSGFIFAHVYLRDGAMRKDVSFLEFAKARFARLYPLHLATLIIVAGLVLWGSPLGTESKVNDLWHFSLNLVMLQQSGLNSGMSFNSPSWSVSVEIFCYIAFYLAAARGDQFLSILALIAVLVGITIADHNNPTAYYIGRGFVGFFVGYFIWRYQKILLKLHWAIYLAIAVIALNLRPEFISYGVFLSLSAWPALLLTVLNTDWLSHPIFRWLGDRSYSIYLIHVPVYYAVNLFVFDGLAVPDGQHLPALLSSWTCILLIAHFSYVRFEAPARKAIRDFKFSERFAHNH